jgi:hypothetical protein
LRPALSRHTFTVIRVNPYRRVGNEFRYALPKKTFGISYQKAETGSINFNPIWTTYNCLIRLGNINRGGNTMARNKNKSIQAKNLAFAKHSMEAENNIAASTDENTNQKGHVPNSPSTG